MQEQKTNLNFKKF